MRRNLTWLILVFWLLACNLTDLPFTRSRSSARPTPTVQPVQFSSATPTTLPTFTSIPLPSPTSTVPPELLVATLPLSPNFTPTPLPLPAEISSPEPPTAAPQPSPTSPAPPVSGVDFVLRYVRLRTNEENSWDGTLGLGQCGSDHSIYVHVADAQENLLDGVLVGDRYGNFEVPTGVDGPGAVRILVWSATMELAVMGHQDGNRYTSDFTPPLSTLDEQIPLDWLEKAGYCDSPEDCRWRVENNQLCRGHYSYDVIFQRTW